MSIPKILAVAVGGTVAPAAASWIVATGEPVAAFTLTCLQVLIALATASFVMLKLKKQVFHKEKAKPKRKHGSKPKLR